MKTIPQLASPEHNSTWRHRKILDSISQIVDMIMQPFMTWATWLKKKWVVPKEKKFTVVV